MVARVERGLQESGSEEQKNERNHQQNGHRFAPSGSVANDFTRRANDKGRRILLFPLKRIFRHDRLNLPALARLTDLINTVALPGQPDESIKSVELLVDLTIREIQSKSAKARIHRDEHEEET